MIIGLVLVVVASLLVLPPLIHPSLTEADLKGVASPETRIQLRQAQEQLQNGLRTALLQFATGLVVVIGAMATWRQVQVNREGQLTDRFTRAVDQIGSDKVDVRIGGVYALERIAKNSPDDRDTVQFILGAFVRNSAPWNETTEGYEHPTAVVEARPWLQVSAPDVQTAVGVLARRIFAPNDRENRRGFPDGTNLYLSRVDLRGVQVHRGSLVNARFRYANLARSWMRGTAFDHSDLKSADLRGSFLRETSFVDANLALALLSGADLRDADLRRADLRGTDLTDADLTGANLDGARSDATTSWPADFDGARS